MRPFPPRWHTLNPPQKEKLMSFSHEKVETNNLLMIVLILLVVAVGGLVEIVPLFFQKSTTQPIKGLVPDSPLKTGMDLLARPPRDRATRLKAHCAAPDLSTSVGPQCAYPNGEVENCALCAVMFP